MPKQPLATDEGKDFENEMRKLLVKRLELRYKEKCEKEGKRVPKKIKPATLGEVFEEYYKDLRDLGSIKDMMRRFMPTNPTSPPQALHVRTIYDWCNALDYPLPTLIKDVYVQLELRKATPNP